MSITSPLLSTDPRRLGSYVLLWRLGGGGMGVVYLGEAQDERLVAGKVIGTVTWLAPEQLRSDRASPLSDVFAWGGLVAYAATGRPPFGTGPAEAVVHRILNEDADLGDTEGELRAMVELALAKNPQE